MPVVHDHFLLFSLNTRRFCVIFDALSDDLNGVNFNDFKKTKSYRKIVGEDYDFRFAG